VNNHNNAASNEAAANAQKNLFLFLCPAIVWWNYIENRPALSPQQ
jgi:hypothetical protein